MRLKFVCVCILLNLIGVGALRAAQTDGFNLPTDLFILLNNGTVQRYVPGSSTPLDVTPPNVFVVDFGISPDGEQIAYRTVDEALIVAPLATPGGGVTVDEAAGVPMVRGRGATIAWSPVGDSIAYTTLTGLRVYFTDGTINTIDQPRLTHLSWSPTGQYLTAEAEGDIWWIYRRDPTGMTLTAAIPSSRGTTWASGSQLIFAPAEGGLILMSLNEGNNQTLLLAQSSAYRQPQLTPDGRLLVFRRPFDDDVIPPEHGQLVALVAGDAEPQPLSGIAIDLSGRLRWAPGAEVMVTFEGGVLALFNPVAGTAVTLPLTNTVTYAWGVYPPVIGPSPGDAPPPAATAAASSDEAIFPDEFPTLDPAQTIPAAPPVIDPNATPEPGTAG